MPFSADKKRSSAIFTTFPRGSTQDNEGCISVARRHTTDTRNTIQKSTNINRQRDGKAALYRGGVKRKRKMDEAYELPWYSARLRSAHNRMVLVRCVYGGLRSLDPT